MACCLAAPSRYLSQCWLIISEVRWYSSASVQTVLPYNEFKSNNFISLRGKWVKFSLSGQIIVYWTTWYIHNVWFWHLVVLAILTVDPCQVKFILRNIKCYRIFYQFLTLIRRMCLESVLVEDNDSFFFKKKSQYHGCMAPWRPKEPGHQQPW